MLKFYSNFHHALTESRVSSHPKKFFVGTSTPIDTGIGYMTPAAGNYDHAQGIGASVKMLEIEKLAKYSGTKRVSRWKRCILDPGGESRC